MKIRILNGGHAAIAYPAALLDIHFVHEAMQDAQIAGFLEADEARDHSDRAAAAGRRHRRLSDQDRRRFANPKIGDTIQRLCLDGSNRQPKFILPSARDRLAAGQAIEGLALVSALWCRYCYGETESGKAIAPNDAGWDRLQTAARAARGRPAAYLEMRDIFGELPDDAGYVGAFSSALDSLWTRGVRATLKDYLARG